MKKHNLANIHILSKFVYVVYLTSYFIYEGIKAVKKIYSKINPGYFLK